MEEILLWLLSRDLSPITKKNQPGDWPGMYSIDCIPFHAFSDRACTSLRTVSSWPATIWSDCLFVLCTSASLAQRALVSLKGSSLWTSRGNEVCSWKIETRYSHTWNSLSEKASLSLAWHKVWPNSHYEELSNSWTCLTISCGSVQISESNSQLALLITGLV